MAYSSNIFDVNIVCVCVYIVHEHGEVPYITKLIVFIVCKWVTPAAKMHQNQPAIILTNDSFSILYR